jgi:hypothetical protein
MNIYLNNNNISTDTMHKILYLFKALSQHQIKIGSGSEAVDGGHN